MLLSTKGTHLYLPFSAFESDMGSFRYEQIPAEYLFGQTNASIRYPATALIEVPLGATYYVWGYAKDYTSNNQGKRYAEIMIDGAKLPDKIGQHGKIEDTGVNGSFGWTKAGSITLSAGRHTVGIIDSSNNYARVAAVLLTTDESFEGFEQGSIGNASDYPATVIEDIIDVSTVSSYGNKVGYVI